MPLAYFTMATMAEHSRARTGPGHPRFNRTLRGYDPAEVEAFIQANVQDSGPLLEELETLAAERDVLQETADRFLAEKRAAEDRVLELQALVERLQTKGSRARSTGQPPGPPHAEPIIQAAQQVADQLRAQATEEAESILRDAERRVAAIYEENRARLQQLQAQYAEARESYEALLKAFRDTAQRLLLVIDESTLPG